MNTTSGTARIDGVLTDKQHIYGRWVRYDSPQLFYGYSPQIWETNETVQNSYGVNHNCSIAIGYQKSDNTFISPQVGKTTRAPLMEEGRMIPSALIGGS